MNPEKTPKVLIAEDDALIAMSLREVLSFVRLEVVGNAASVNEALCLAQNTQPDLAIFDMRLAGKRDGIEGAALLRDIMDIPVVSLTANGDQDRESSSILSVQARELAADRRRGRKRADGVGLWSKEDEGLEEK